MGFARPVSALVPKLAERPTPGQGLTLDGKGQVPPSVLKLSPEREAATADLTLTTSDQEITGCSTTLVEPGTYLVWGVFDFQHSAAGGGVAVGNLYVDGTAETSIAPLEEGAVRGTVSQVWLVTTTGRDTEANLQASKTVNAGTVAAKQNHTTLTVLRVG